MLNRLSVFLIYFCLSAPSSAAIYQYTDDQGNVIFSDKPIPGGTQIRQSKPSVVPAPQRKPNTNPAATFTTEQKLTQEKTQPKKPEKAKQYKRVSIVSPEDDQGYRSNDGTVKINVSLKPELQVKFGHHLQLVLDGKKLKQEWDSASIELLNVDRGTHTISVIVVDGQEKKLKQSKPITFHLLRYSMLFRP